MAHPAVYRNAQGREHPFCGRSERASQRDSRSDALRLLSQHRQQRGVVADEEHGGRGRRRGRPPLDDGFGKIATRRGRIRDDRPRYTALAHRNRCFRAADPGDETLAHQGASTPLPAPGVGCARWRLELLRCRAGENAVFEGEACDAKGRVVLPPKLGPLAGSGRAWAFRTQALIQSQRVLGQAVDYPTCRTSREAAQFHAQSRSRLIV